METTKKFSQIELEQALQALADEEKYGTILRAKGIVAGEGTWLHFDYIPEEHAYAVRLNPLTAIMYPERIVEYSEILR